MKRFKIILEVEDYWSDQTQSDMSEKLIEPYTVEELQKEFQIGYGISDIAGLRITKSEVEEIE